MRAPAPRFHAYAPGRIELLGNHTDYNQGLVLGAAIDRGLTVTVEQRDDDTIIIRSSITGEVAVSLPELQPQDGDRRWANYPLGVAAELRSLGVPIPGFSAVVEGDLPAGNGLSSSAAFEVATALCLLKMTKHELPRLQLAKICQRAEHRFAGVKSGLLDQVTCIFGEAGHVVYFDCRSEEVRTLPFPSNLAFVIAESGAPRELSSGKYNIRRRETATAARILGLNALRDISLKDLEQRTDLDPELQKRARHVVGENERVSRAAELLAAGREQELGELMNASHESSRVNFENSTPELDLLVELARGLTGVLGARLTGGGFGGATITLCRREHAPAVATALTKAYQDRTKIRTRPFVTGAAAGAR
ncbi:MAG TPA: galactokinase [Chthoniobacterales bacterium]|nr:galactokinase [Chthoniobacterales bacterium]